TPTDECLALVLGDREFVLVPAILSIEFDAEPMPARAWIGAAVVLDPFNAGDAIVDDRPQYARRILAALIDDDATVMQITVAAGRAREHVFVAAVRAADQRLRIRDPHGAALRTRREMILRSDSSAAFSTSNCSGGRCCSITACTSARSM